MRVNSSRVTLALIGLLVVAGGAFAIGRATATEGEPAAAGAAAIDAPTGPADVPSLRNVGALPGLRAAPPASGSSGSTASEVPSQPAPSEPAPTQPAPAQPQPSEPAPVEPPPPPPPGEG